MCKKLKISSKIEIELHSKSINSMSGFGILNLLNFNNQLFSTNGYIEELYIIIKKILNNEVLDIHVGNNVIGGRRWFYAGDVASHTGFVLNNQTQSCEKWNSAGNKFINNFII